MSERFLSRPQYLSLKAATRALVAANGTQQQAAAVTRLDQSDLSRGGSNSLPDRFLPLDVIADLEAASGEPIITRALAELSGCVLIEPALDEEASETLSREVGHSAQRFGELMTNYGQASADAVITPDEARQIARDAYAMIRELWHVAVIAHERAREAGHG